MSPQGDLRHKERLHHSKPPGWAAQPRTAFPKLLVAPLQNPCKPELMSRQAAYASHPRGPGCPPPGPLLPGAALCCVSGSNEPTSCPLEGRFGAQGPEAASQHSLSRQEASTLVPTPLALPRQPQQVVFLELGLAQPPGPAGHVAKLVPPLPLPRLLSAAVSCRGEHNGACPMGPALGRRQPAVSEGCVTPDEAHALSEARSPRKK